MTKILHMYPRIPILCIWAWIFNSIEALWSCLHHDHEVVPCHVAFSMVTLSCSNLRKMECLKPLDPSLGVNQTWTKRSDHEQKSECVDIWICVVLRIFHVLPSCFLLALCPFNYIIVWQTPRNIISLPWSPDLCSERTASASLTAKNHWTMTVNNNVGM